MAIHIEQNTVGKRLFLVRVAFGLTQGQFATFHGLAGQAMTASESDGQAVRHRSLSDAASSVLSDVSFTGGVPDRLMHIGK